MPCRASPTVRLEGPQPRRPGTRTRPRHTRPDDSPRSEPKPGKIAKVSCVWGGTLPATAPWRIIPRRVLGEMTAAVLGLVGVLLGILIGGLVTVRAERAKGRGDAKAAGRLIRAEIWLVENRITASVTSGKPWPLPLPTAAWTEHAIEIVGVISPLLLRQLSSLYVSITLQNSVTPPQLETLDQLAKDCKAYGEALEESFAPTSIRRKYGTLIPAGAVVSFILVVAVLSAVVARPTLNQQTVTAAVQTVFTHDSVVCAQERDMWACNVYEFASCPTNSLALTLSTTYAAGPTSQSCRATEHSFNVDVLPKKGFLNIEATSAAAEQQLHAGHRAAALPRDRLVSKIWRVITGND